MQIYQSLVVLFYLMTIIKVDIIHSLWKKLQSKKLSISKVLIMLLLVV